MTVRPPVDVLCVELPPVEKRYVFSEVDLESTYIFQFWRPKVKVRTYISIQQLIVNNMQRTNAIEYFAVSSKCTTITVRVRLSLSYFNNLFHWSNDGEGWYWCSWLHVKILFLPWNIGRAPYSARLISKTPVGHRTMSNCGECYHIQTPVGARTIYDKALMPGRFSNFPVSCKSLKSYGDSFICDHSIRA